MGAIQDEIEDRYWRLRRIGSAERELKDWKDVLEALNKVPTLRQQAFESMLNQLKDHAKARIYENIWVNNERTIQTSI